MQSSTFSYCCQYSALEIKDKSKHGVQLEHDSSDIVLLLFADDIVLVADTVAGLQNQIDNLVGHKQTWLVC